MSLYYDASTVLSSDAKIGGSFKSRVYNSKDLKSAPAQVYALVAECAKWDLFLKEVIENAGILDAERKLTPLLALLLTHDLLLSKRGVAAPTNHPLRVAIEKHKTRLRAEFTKLRVKRGCATVDDLKAHIAKEKNLRSGKGAHATSVNPRWVRINNVVTTLGHELQSTFASYTRVGSLNDLEKIQQEDAHKGTKSRRQVYYVDNNIPDLIAVPQSTELTVLRAYKEGKIILQDKASCFPAYLLLGDSGMGFSGNLIDGCAAPGNKTTHLASLLRSGVSLENKMTGLTQQIYSLDASKIRSKTLKKMVHVAGADKIVTVLEGQDFLALDPRDERFENVTGLLLDPSCSGSGIQGRDDVPELILPESKHSTTNTGGKKRKRHDKAEQGRDPMKGNKNSLPAASASPLDPASENEIAVSEEDTERLIKLSNLQTRIVEHALKFPAAKRVTYSTCSIHGLENENVVHRILRSEVARRGEWRILKRSEQVEGLQQWTHRGVPQEKPVHGLDSQNITWKLTDEEMNACLRCYQGGEEGTGGFFVVAFVRDQSDVEAGRVEDNHDDADEEEGEEQDDDYEEEWEGFSSD
ncbi:hypothetical protein KEM56_006133 [Ascosphaera pollenicola]|nr:hypothetical protein KEM56_006133 [Ascosphaera pollenicola]